MITEAEPSRETRRLITAIHDLSELESQIPLCQTIDEVEEIRARTMGIQSYERNHHNIGSELVNWAKRCAVLCQLRITEIQLAAKAKREGKSGEVTPSSNFAPAEKVRRSELRTILSMPKEELHKELDAGNTNPQKLVAIARKVRKKDRPKSSPEQLEAARARYYRNKAKNRPVAPPSPKRSLAQKFERYWPHEEKLLWRTLNQ